MTIGETIKKLRMALCLEQQEFAEQLGVTKSSVSYWEKSLKKPRLPIIRKMLEMARANKVKITLEDFLN